MNTKEKILDISLNLFSKYGYSDVSVDNIAKEVGIKAPSIYKHFKSKKEIFDTILDTAFINLDDNIHNIDEYKIIADDKVRLDIEKLAIDIFKYLLHDPFASKVRRMICIEMYKNPQAMQFYIDKFIENPMSKQAQFINSFGLYEYGDLKVLSNIFYSPIILAVRLYDADPKKEDEIVDTLKKTYSKLGDIFK